MRKIKEIVILITAFIFLYSSFALAQIVIDNTDPGFQLTGSGSWEVRHNPPWPSYGNDFRFTGVGYGENQAVYTFDIPESGNYEIYAWWPTHSICSQDTPYTIFFSNGPVTVRVNQQQNPGQWNFLATGFFEEGEHQIIISDEASGTVVVADAIRLVPIQPPNNAPVLDSIGNKMIDELELLEFTITASDPDNDDLTYAAENLPDGATFDPEFHVFSWIPDYDQTDNYTVLFTVADNGDPILSDSEEITITVGNINRPPILNPIGNRTVYEEDLLEFTVTASDPDNDDLTYAAENLPDGAPFDPETQIFSWTPDWQSSGEHKDIIFSVSDAADYDEELITIDVIDISPLEAPTGLMADQNETTITLYWNVDTKDELAGYNIYRSTSNPGNYQKLNYIPITSTQYIDDETEPGTTYYYFVTAIDVFDQTEVIATGLKFPLDIAFNDEDRLFASSWTDGIVWNIEYDGNYSVYASDLGTVAVLTFHNDDLFCTDWSGGTVNRVTPDGDVFTFAEALDHPSGIAFNQIGEAFVAEDWGGRILKSSDEGTSWDLFTEGLDGPGKITFDTSGNLYVSEDLWVGDDFIGAIDIIYPDGNMDVLANITDPDGICLDQSGNLYVGQSEASQITKVMPDGNSMPIVQDITPWGCSLNKNGELIVSLPWEGQIIKVHLSHESDISDIVSITTSSPFNNPPILYPLSDMSVDEDQ
ncbi:MAG: hypothetical protein KAH93_04745, partial [Candidatus Aenigmarchaeota archaeon]|nr:hypothetical protein [Candidatus Aenigmarchaeota archaeon]